VTSSIYEVSQEDMIISLIPMGSGVRSFLANIVPVTGATIMVVDRLGNVREQGIIAYDDRLMVVSEDQSVTVDYFLNFIGEFDPDIRNLEPTVQVTAPATAEKGTAVSFVGEASDDGQPEGSVLTYLWEVTSGDAASVSIANADQLTTDVTFNATGDFELSLTVSDGELEVTVVHSITVTPGVGIEQFDKSAISIYPNPARDLVHVAFGASAQVKSQIRVVDMVGKVAYLGDHYDSKVQIDLDGFDAGIYFMVIDVEDQTLVRKLDIVK
jgi:hypothetical protein